MIISRWLQYQTTLIGFRKGLWTISYKVWMRFLKCNYNFEFIGYLNLRGIENGIHIFEIFDVSAAVANWQYIGKHHPALLGVMLRFKSLPYSNYRWRNMSSGFQKSDFYHVKVMSLAKVWKYAVAKRYTLSALRLANIKKDVIQRRLSNSFWECL